MLDDLIKIMTEAKILKCPVIYIDNDKIYGTDLDFTFLKTVTFINETSLKQIIYTQNSVSRFIKDIEEIDEVIINNYNIFNKTKNTFIEINNIKMMQMMIELINNTNNMTQQTFYKFIKEDLQDKEDFSKIMNAKTDEGTSIYKIDREYMLSIYNNLLPVNKKDKVSLIVYDHNNLFMANFKVFKKKNVTVDVYILYRKFLHHQ